MIYPPGYLEAQAEKEKEAGNGKKRGKDDSQEEEDFIDDDAEDEEAAKPPKAKKAKLSYKLSSEWKELMAKDSVNTKLWDEVKSLEVANKKELLYHVEEVFCCIICQDIVFKPVTTPCHHNFCLSSSPVLSGVSLPQTRRYAATAGTSWARIMYRV